MPSVAAPQVYTRGRLCYSAIQKERLAADCNDYLPKAIESPVSTQMAGCEVTDPKIKELFPCTYDRKAIEFQNASKPIAGARMNMGVVLSGGQAPGGHNVIAGVFDQAKRVNPESKLYGFLDGPHGIFTGNYVELTDEIIDGFRNTGGFDMIGSGRHKIETPDQFENCLKTCTLLDLDGLVVIGGDDSNTNGAVLAEYFVAQKSKTKVVGCPKTIDGDLKVPPYLPISFGFDTACRTYAELVGNVAVDAMSTQKYYHFVRLMGRSASNIALEVALQTCANVCLIGEEVMEQKKSLKELTKELVAVIEKRHEMNKHYGVILLPEGLIEFIPEFELLIKDINDVLATKIEGEPTEAKVVAQLSDANKEVFLYLPEFIREQLMLDRDPHGNVQVAKIETEKLLAATIQHELKQKFEKSLVDNIMFVPHFHAFGYEGRAGLPTLFDSSYCYALGATATTLVNDGNTGLIASVQNLLAPVKEWRCGGVPVTALCGIERRKGKDKPVITKALVELEGKPFAVWKSIRDVVAVEDLYRVPGPMQFANELDFSTEVPITLQLELGGEYTFIKDVSCEKTESKKRCRTFSIEWPERQSKFVHFGPEMKRSAIQEWRASTPEYRVPLAIAASLEKIQFSVSEKTQTCTSTSDRDFIKKSYPTTYGAPLIQFMWQSDAAKSVKVAPGQKVGVVFCGRQAPGGHDVLAGIVKAVTAQKGEVLGFIGGTAGFLTSQYVDLTTEIVEKYQRTGGFELLGRSQDKFGSDFGAIKAVCDKMKLKSLLLLGSFTTATSAAALAEYMKKESADTSIVCVPMGTGGALVNNFVEQPLGFDSNARATARIVGNTAIDGSSARKYYYFLRTMEADSQPTSHVALEAALQTKPNMLLLGEEVMDGRMTLRDVVNSVADMVENRFNNGKKNFGTVLIPEGFLLAIPEFGGLIQELNSMAELALSSVSDDESSFPNVVKQSLSPWSRALIESLPEFASAALFRTLRLEKKINLTKLETERLIAEMTKKELKSRKTYAGSFSPVCQFLGYQARCSVPSDFDCNYGYALGHVAARLALIPKSDHDVTGYVAVCSNLASEVEDWSCNGVPLSAFLTVKVKGGNRAVPAVAGAPVNLKGASYQAWKKLSAQASLEECYENPGPIQFVGSCAGGRTENLRLSNTTTSYMDNLKLLNENAAQVSELCQPGCSAQKLQIATDMLSTLSRILAEKDE